jgi:hypothetical protein
MPGRGSYDDRDDRDEVEVDNSREGTRPRRGGGLNTSVRSTSGTPRHERDESSRDLGDGRKPWTPASGNPRWNDVSSLTPATPSSKQWAGTK